MKYTAAHWGSYQFNYGDSDLSPINGDPQPSRIGRVWVSAARNQDARVLTPVARKGWLDGDAAQLARIDTLDMVVYSIGTVEDDTRFVAAGMATKSELKTAREGGAVGVICCCYIDADGLERAFATSDGLVSAKLEALCAIAKRMLVVLGADRAAATRAAVAAGLANHLCCDQELAVALLAP